MQLRYCSIMLLQLSCGSPSEKSIHSSRAAFSSLHTQHGWIDLLALRKFLRRKARWVVMVGEYTLAGVVVGSDCLRSGPAFRLEVVPRSGNSATIERYGAQYGSYRPKGLDQSVSTSSRSLDDTERWLYFVHAKSSRSFGSAAQLRTTEVTSRRAVPRRKSGTPISLYG